MNLLEIQCLFQQCRKDDLLEIADHFKIPVSKQLLKKSIKASVFQKLDELNVFAKAAEDEAAEKPPSRFDVSEAGLGDTVEGEAEAKVTIGLSPIVSVVCRFWGCYAPESAPHSSSDGSP